MSTETASRIANKKHSDVQRWVCIYPAYIDSQKSKQQGRRIAKQIAVERPTQFEIRDVLATANIKVQVEESSRYPRETSNDIDKRGRVRVQIKNDDGTPVNAQFATRDSLLLYSARGIVQLRNGRLVAAKSGATTSGNRRNAKGGKR